MADIAAQPFINYGLSGAQQQQTLASADLERQQAAGAAMQNRIMAAKLPMLLQAYSDAQGHITDFSGQTNGHDIAASGYDPAADSSGVNSTPTNARVTPFDHIGRTAAQEPVAQAAIQSRYNVDPAGTPQEQAKIGAAYLDLQRLSLLGDQGITKSAEARLDAAKYERDMAVKSRLNARDLDASQHFETLSSVANADRPFEALRAADPASAARIRAMNPGADPDQLDMAAKEAASRTAGLIHRFTGRETVKGDDGLYRDKDTAQVVPDATPAGFSAEQIAKIREDGLKQVTVKRNGVDTSLPQWEAAGFKNVDQYVQQAVAQGRSQQASEARIERARQAGVIAQAQAGIPADARQPAPGQQLPASAVAAKAAAAQQPAPTTRPAPMSPNAGGKQLDFSSAPKPPVPEPGKNSAYPAGYEDYQKEVNASATVAAQKLAGANAAKQGARNAELALESGAATGGLGAMKQWTMNVIGNPSALQWALGNASARQVLEKVLGNDAIMDIQREAQGSQFRLGQNTMNMAINKLAASPQMQPEAIRTMLGAIVKNADYDRQKWGADYAAYLRSGKVDKRADAYSGWYDDKYPNTTTIDTATLTGKSIADRVREAGHPYEPDKYEYRLNGDTVQRRPK